MKHNNIKTIRFLFVILLVGVSLICGGDLIFEAKATTTQTTSGQYTVLAPLPCIEGGGITCPGGNGATQDKVDFKTYVQYTINLLIGLSAVVAVVMIVWGGVEYMYTASFSGKKMGLEKVTHAIYGLVLVLTSYIILRTIDPRLVEIPNTIVPTIEVRDVLMRDASALLINKLVDDASRARVPGIEIGKEIEAARAEVLEHKQTLAVIDKELSTVDKSTPEGKLRSETLETQQKKTAEALRSAEVERAIASAKQSFNGQISSTIGDFSNNITSKETVQTRMKLLNTNIANIEKLRLEKIKQLQSLGEVDMSPINNEAEYAKTVVNIYKINLMILSAQQTEQNDGAGYVELVKMDGNYDMFIDGAKSSGSQKAKEYVNEQIAAIAEQIKTMSPEIKDDLKTRLDGVSGFLTTSEVLNKK